MMDEELKKTLKYLRLYGPAGPLGRVTLDGSQAKAFSAERLLRHVFEAEYRIKNDSARKLRRKRAHIPELLEIETFPFARLQRKLDRKRIMSLYDSFDYMTKQQNIDLDGSHRLRQDGSGHRLPAASHRSRSSRLFYSLRQPGGRTVRFAGRPFGREK